MTDGRFLRRNSWADGGNTWLRKQPKADRFAALRNGDMVVFDVVGRELRAELPEQEIPGASGKLEAAGAALCGAECWASMRARFLRRRWARLRFRAGWRRAKDGFTGVARTAPPLAQAGE